MNDTSDMTRPTDPPEMPIGCRWQPGKSGNPGGRPRITAEVRRLAQEHSAAAVNELARLAREAQNEGTRVAACNALLDRALGRAPASIPEPIELPETATPAGLVEGVAAVLQAVATGRLSSTEAGNLVAILETQRKAIETVDLEERLSRLEASQPKSLRRWGGR